MISYPSFLLEVGDHDDNSNVLLPNHPPEVFPARSERSLSCNVSPCSLITLQKKQLICQTVDIMCQYIQKKKKQDHKDVLTSTKLALM